MTTPAKHRYTFALRTWPDGPRHALPSDVRESADATSPNEAEELLRDRCLSAERLVLVSIDPAGELCPNERCAICRPSSRNVVVR